MLTIDQLTQAYDHESVALDGETGSETLTRCHGAALQRVATLATEDARVELFREIEGVEARHPGESVLAHLQGVDQGACHERDREVAAHVASALVVVLKAEIEKLTQCDGRVDPSDIVDLLDRVNISGKAIASAPSAPPTPDVAHPRQGEPS